MKIFKKDDYIKNNIISSSLKKITGDTAAHGHNFFELEFIVDGTGTYEIDGIKYEIKKNSLFLMTPANVHAIQNADATLINIMFLYEYHQEKLDIPVFLNNSPHFMFNNSDGVFLSSLLFELVDVNENNPAYAMMLVNCILKKLSICFNPPQNISTSYVQKSVLYMLENFQKGVTLRDTAKHLGLSSAYFSDLFQKQTGINFKDYLDDIRFSYAKKLLTLTKLSIKEIQFNSGFSDYANFARRFKQKYNMTPTDYRKNL